MIALAWIAAAAAPAFAPPLDIPIRYEIVETRDGDGAPIRFRMEREVVFRRTPIGLVADVRMVAVDGHQAGGPGKLFEAAFAELARRKVTVTLDGEGVPIAIDDREALWTTLIESIARGMAAGGGNPAIRALFEQLRAASPERQLRMLAGGVTPLVGVDVARRGATAATAIRVPTQGQTAVPAFLEGTEGIVALDDGHLRFERRAAGSIGAERAISTLLTRRVDPRTGLVTDVREETTTTVAGRRLTIERVTRLLLPKP